MARAQAALPTRSVWLPHFALHSDQSAVTGVYFQWNNEPANPNVKEWNVTELRVSVTALAGLTPQIDRQRRHVDKQIVGSFWRVLDGGKVR
jgi:parafibromin